MTLELQILCAVGLDLLLGDPRWLPHPVRGVAWLAARLERLTRRLFGGTRVAGVVTAFGVYATAGALTWAVIVLAGRFHPWAGDAVAIVAIYATIAARDLVQHSVAVYRALRAGGLAEARRRVAMIVGRDAGQLDEAGVSRAAVESVAESTVDGVTAPLFYAILFGPVGAVVHRAINTLDSMFGHKDERHLHFGWASARVDDAANFLPARLTAVAMTVAAVLTGFRGRDAWRIVRRDARNHDSPNAGFPEAAMAGALAVQLGGASYYDGQLLAKPTIGDALTPLVASHIRQANALMFATLAVFVALGLALRALWRAAA